MRRLIAVIATAMIVSGCATTGPAVNASKPEAAAPDWDALFSAFAIKESEIPSPEKERAARFFSGNEQATAEAVIHAVNTEGYPRAAFGGACDAARYLKAERCLPAIEAALLSKTDWFLRYACANAIDSIDAESSKNAVVSALGAETHPLVAMLCSMYLARHPVPASRETLERKLREFSARTDESSIIACVFLEDALVALDTGN